MQYFGTKEVLQHVVKRFRAVFMLELAPRTTRGVTHFGVLRYCVVVLRCPATEVGGASFREQDAEHLLWMPGNIWMFDSEADAV